MPSDSTQQIYAPNLHVCPYLVPFMYHGSTMVLRYSSSTTVMPCYTLPGNLGPPGNLGLFVDANSKEAICTGQLTHSYAHLCVCEWDCVT